MKRVRLKVMRECKACLALACVGRASLALLVLSKKLASLCALLLIAPEYREVNLGVGKMSAGPALPSMATGCIRDILVPNPTGGEAVQIGCPADLSGNPCRNDGIYALTALVFNFAGRDMSSRPQGFVP